MAKKQKRVLKRLSKTIRSSKMQMFLGGVLANAIGRLLTHAAEFVGDEAKKITKKTMKLAQNGKHHERHAVTA
jgi:hypothetical protein